MKTGDLNLFYHVTPFIVKLDVSWLVMSILACLPHFNKHINFMKEDVGRLDMKFLIFQGKSMLCMSDP